MTLTRKQLGLIALIFMATSSSACFVADPQMLSRMNVIDTQTILSTAGVIEAIREAQKYGRILASSAGTLLALVCFYRSQSGAGFQQLMLDMMGGILLSAYVLMSAGTSAGVSELLLGLGKELEGAFTTIAHNTVGDPAVPPMPMVGQPSLPLGIDSPVAELGGALIATLAQVIQSVDGNNKLAGTAQEAFVRSVLDPKVAFLYNLNTSVSYFARITLNVANAWLVAFHQIVLPLLAWTIILPGTRNIAIGWLKSYVAVCLWPFFFALISICNRATVGMIQADLQRQGDPLIRFLTGEAELAIMNLVVIGMYFAVPMIAKKIVNGAGETFKVGFSG